VASNWLVKTGKESNMRIQLSGLYDREKGEQYHIAQYGDVSTPTVIEETSTSETYRREWNAGVYYTVNSSKIRVENRVVGNLNYNESSGSTSLNGRHISQHVTPRKRSIGDALMINKNLFKNDILSLNSIFDYNYLPGTLTLHYGNEENLNVHALNWASLLLNIGPSFSLSQPRLDRSGWEAKINVWRLPSGGRYEYSGIYALWRPQVGC
jgi:hypothetical protein